MTSTEKSTRLPSPPGSGVKSPPGDTPSPNASTSPFFSTSGFSAPLVASPFTTSYTPFQTISNVSGASSHASVKQQSRAEVVARTVHLRCLPPFMQQKELAAVFDACGEYLRVRICGNAATHQKWVYGFVEFATTAAAAAMLTHSGMELSNGPDKPPLRLKCSPSKQPILDCMAYDADVVAGTPCGFGRGYLAECTLNDALLVVGNGAAASATGGGGGGVDSAASVTDSRGGPPNEGSAECSCDGATCCGCCPCKRAGKVATHHDSASPLEEAMEAGGGRALTVRTAAKPATASGATIHNTVLYPVSKYTSIVQLVAVPPVGRTQEVEEIKQLAAAVEGLRSTAAGDDGQLDGPAIVRRAETMTLEALTRASHLSSDTRLQDILCDLTQLLSFLDANAALTGGAAQTASGDCTATLPQRVTQMRLLANLVGALLCLLRRSVADAVPFVEAVLVTIGQIPPSPLLLRSLHQNQSTAFSHTRASPGLTGVAGGVIVSAEAPSPKGRPAAAAVAAAKADKRTSSRRREHLISLSRGAFVDDAFTDALLDLIEDGDDDDGNVSTDGVQDGWSPNGAYPATVRNGGHAGFANSTTQERLHALLLQQQQQQAHPTTVAAGAALRRSDSVSSLSSDGSVAYLDSADMADLHRQSTFFTGYSLNVLVAIGIAMEELQPELARSAYALANKRSIEVFGHPSQTLVKCLAATASGNPHLREELFEVTEKETQARDVTFFPQCFFESVRATWVRVRDTRGTDGFYCLLPPNYVVPLFRSV